MAFYPNDILIKKRELLFKLDAINEILFVISTPSVIEDDHPTLILIMVMYYRNSRIVHLIVRFMSMYIPFS